MFANPFTFKYDPYPSGGSHCTYMYIPGPGPYVALLNDGTAREQIIENQKGTPSQFL